MGVPSMRCRAVVAALLVLACVAALGQAAPAPDPEDEGGDDVADEASNSDELKINKGDDAEGTCPTSKPGSPCSGSGKCISSEDQGFVCDCNAGYHGDDCGELDDQFDVYFNRMMAQSKTTASRGKVVLSDSPLAAWDTRMAGLKKRFALEKEDVERYVNNYVEIQNHFLKIKEEQVEKHQAVVDALKAEVADLQEKEGKRIDDDVATMKETIQKKMLVNAEKELKNADAFENLQNKVRTGDTLGENSRFHRIMEHWTLCDIHPNHPDCKDPVENKLPGVHVVVETNNAAKFYPKSLAADEMHAQKTVKHTVKS